MVTVWYSWSGHAVRLDTPPNSFITLLDVPLRRSVILVVLAAVWTQNVIAVRQKPASEQQRTTFVADEAIGVPLTPLERYELGTVHACNGFCAGGTLLGKQLSVAVDAVRSIFYGRETFAAEDALTVRTAETVAMPRAVVVDDPAFADRQRALGTRLAVLAFIARNTDDVAGTRYEAAGSDLSLTDHADETLSMPLTTPVLVFLHTGAKDLFAACASRREHLLVTRGAEQLIVLERERLVDKRRRTRTALEALVMPVLVPVR